ncbi:Lipase family protein [Geitlerinema sp. FC II]|nr:Lipase family protein [Geitlerinema sp. FC II]
MAKLNRRQMLIAGLVAGAATSVTVNYLRDRMAEDTSEGKADLGFEEETPLERLLEVRDSVTLTPPEVPYDRALSSFFVRCCRLGTEQYLKAEQSLQDALQYDGAISQLESYTEEFEAYRQVASFKAEREPGFLEKQIKKHVLKEMEVPEIRQVYYGFVLTSPQHHIVVFRGTQELDEWIANLDASQEYYRIYDISPGRVHKGFNDIYQETLDEQVRAVVGSLDPNLPCYFTGHSLGGALAVLAAIDIAESFSDRRARLRAYTYGTPRVGDPIFAKYYSELVPNTYRIVNIADVTPTLPPTVLGKQVYLHVGQEWSFLNQTGDMSPNHQLAAYRAAIDRQIEQTDVTSYNNIATG